MHHDISYLTPAHALLGVASQNELLLCPPEVLIPLVLCAVFGGLRITRGLLLSMLTQVVRSLVFTHLMSLKPISSPSWVNHTNYEMNFQLI